MGDWRLWTRAGAKWPGAILMSVALIGLAPGPATAQTGARAARPYTTAETPIGVLAADPAARAVLDKSMPGLSRAAQTVAVRNAPLKAMQSFAGPALSDARLAEIDAQFARLPPKPWSPHDVPWPINVDEAKVGSYRLPDPLKLANGAPVRDARIWWSKRRPQILAMFETQQFGRAPGRPADESFEVIEAGAPAFGGKAIRKQVLIHLAKDAAAPTIQLVEYLPAGAKGPAPMFLTIGFTAASRMFNDPGVRPGLVWNPQTGKRGPAPASPLGAIPVESFIDAGIGVAGFYYGDVEPDFPEGYPMGVRAYFAKGAPLAADEWGAVAAWAWAASRVQDFFETDPAVDARRVALNGASRLGKTVLWAAAQDQRFALVTACCSGEGGAALSRRNFGQTIGEMTAEAPHQFALNYRRYGGREASLPMDAHMLLALIAPRPVLLQTGRYDSWSDPKGEYLAAVAATPVYRLLGEDGLSAGAWPPAGPSLGQIGYMMNDSGHGMQPGDWKVYLAFVQKHVGAQQAASPPSP